MKVISVNEMQELDRKTIEEIGIPSIILMENAGREASEVAVEMIGVAPERARCRKRAAIFCGTGNNGGDGFVVARHLLKKGFEVGVYIVGEKARIKNDPLINLKILERLGVKIEEIISPLEITADLIIDAIFGIGLKGEVKESARSIIKDLNSKKVPILSIDVPSGLDADTGEVLGETVKATKTVTMQFPKKGFYVSKGPEYVGEVVAVDIGIG